MKLAHVRLNSFWVPTVYDWAPVDIAGEFSAEDGICTIPFGRKDHQGNYPFEIWMTMANAPELRRSWWVNWSRYFVTEGEPESKGDIVALKAENDVSAYGSDALFLLIDLHNGRRPPGRGLDQNFNGNYTTATHQLVNQLYLAQVNCYPIGAMVVYPGYRAKFSPEGTLARYNLWYNPEGGIEIFSEEPSDAELRMMAAAIGYRSMMWH